MHLRKMHMLTAVDTNIVFDAVRLDSPFRSQSIEWLARAYDRGGILVCDVVYAELVPQFRGDRARLDEALRRINAIVSPIDTDIAYEAGRRFRQYHRAGGPRTRIIADFLIGAHALVRADHFLTRDRGFYATYFSELSRGAP